MEEHRYGDNKKRKYTSISKSQNEDEINGIRFILNDYNQHSNGLHSNGLQNNDLNTQLELSNEEKFWDEYLLMKKK